MFKIDAPRKKIILYVPCMQTRDYNVNMNNMQENSFLKVY